MIRRLVECLVNPVTSGVSFRAAKTARNPAATERDSCLGTGFLDRPPPLRGSGGSE